MKLEGFALSLMIASGCFAAELPELKRPPDALESKSAPIVFQLEPKIGVRLKKLPEIELPPRGGAGALQDFSRVELVSIHGLIDLFGGKENFGIVAVPALVQLHRLEKKRKYAHLPNDFEEREQASLSLEDSRNLRSILTSDATFNWYEEPDCLPTYGFRVKFLQDGKVITVDLCFECRVLRVALGDKHIAEKNFEFGYENLGRIIARYFPKEFEKLPTISGAKTFDSAP